MRKQLFFYIFVVLLFVLENCKAENTSIIKVAFNSERINRDKDGKLFGPVIEQFDCVTKKLGLKYEILDVSWNQAQFLFKQKKLDMLPYSLYGSRRNNYATFSKIIHDEKFVLTFSDKYVKNRVIPVGIEKLVKMLIKRNYRVAGKLSSPSTIKLEEMGVKSIKAVQNLKDMIIMQEKGFVDVFIVDLDTIRDYEKENGVEFIKRWAFNIPRGYYVNNNYIALHPDIMVNLNKALDKCPLKQ
ncbi:MAG: hypothetical protein ACI4V7_00835 [Succinivibrionaceae bacterium]